MVERLLFSAKASGFTYLERAMQYYLEITKDCETRKWGEKKTVSI
jgi:hypothetical protein